MVRMLIAAALLAPMVQAAVLRGAAERSAVFTGRLVAGLLPSGVEADNISVAVSSNTNATDPQRAMAADRNAGPENCRLLRLLPLLTLIGGSVWLIRDKLRGMTFNRAEALELLAAVVVYYTSSPFVIFVNSDLMNHFGFRFPVTTGSMGVLSTMIIAQIMVCSGRWIIKGDMSTKIWLRSVLPVALCGAAALACGNKVYMYLPISLVQMLKSCTLVFTLGFGLLAGVEKFRWDIFSAIFVIAIASAAVQFAGLEGQRHTSTLNATFAIGLVLNLCACSCENGRVIMTQVAVADLNFQDSLYWCSRAMLGVNAVLILATEAQDLVSASVDVHVARALAASALCGSVSTLSGWWLTKLVGGLSLKVLSETRNYVVATMAVYLYAEPLMPLSSICYALCIASVFFYQKCRSAPVQNSTGESKP